MKLSDIARKIILALGVSLLILITASIVYYRSFSFLPFALGALFGVAISAVKVIMLERTVDKAIKMEAKNAGNYIRLQHLLRLLLTGLALILAVFVPFINLWGAVAGILALQLSMFYVKLRPN